MTLIAARLIIDQYDHACEHHYTDQPLKHSNSIKMTNKHSLFPSTRSAKATRAHYIDHKALKVSSRLWKR